MKLDKVFIASFKRHTLFKEVGGSHIQYVQVSSNMKIKSSGVPAISQASQVISQIEQVTSQVIRDIDGLCCSLLAP